MGCACLGLSLEAKTLTPVAQALLCAQPIMQRSPVSAFPKRKTLPALWQVGEAAE